MRPIKLTDKLLAALKEVVDEWHNALVCTDEEICMLMNERLPADEQISYRTFQRYKAYARELYGNPEKVEYFDGDPNEAELIKLYGVLHRELMKVNVRVKNYCMDKIKEGAKTAHHYRWLFMMRIRYWNDVGPGSSRSNHHVKLDNKPWISPFHHI